MSTLGHAELLLEQLEKQRERGFLCDCTVTIGPSSYQAHRNVLAAFSEFFASRSSLEGETVTTIDTEWVNETTFQRLLNFVYTGNLNIESNDDVSDIRKAATYLGMQEVLHKCDQLCQTDEKPSLEAIIQACNAVAAAEAAAEAMAERSAPSPEPADSLPPLPVVEESEEQENTEQNTEHNESHDKQSSTWATSESSALEEQAASMAKKRVREPDPKPSDTTCGSSTPRGRGRGRGRQSGRGRGRPSGMGRGRGRPPKKITLEEPATDTPINVAEPSTEGQLASSTDDPDFSHEGEDDDPLNTAKVRKSGRKRVPSKKLRESSASVAELEVEIGKDGDDEVVEGEEEQGEVAMMTEGEAAMMTEEGEAIMMVMEGVEGGETQLRARSLDGKLRPICSTCGKCFSEVSSLRRHMRIHKGLKPYECLLCNRTFRQGNQLKTHMRIHTGEKPFKCDKCDKSFAQKCQLVFHCRMHHGEEKPYQCNDCGLQFATSSNLKIHCRKHSGEKPYKCDLCGKCFAQASTLTYHMRRHTGEKPYVCDTCGRAFAVSSSLITHSRKHAKERQKKAEEEASSNAPYLCLVCGKRFFTTGELRKHMDSHGYKRVKCDLCGQMFADSSGMKKHKEKKHGAVEIEETLTSGAVPLNIPIDHQGLIARMCASPLNPSGVTFEQLEIPADTAASMETTQIVIVHTIEAE